MESFFSSLRTERVARKLHRTRDQARAEAVPPVVPSNMAALHRKRISVLHESLQAEATRADAAEILRTLIERIMIRITVERGLSLSRSAS